MAKKITSEKKGEHQISARADDLLLAAQERGDDSLETGRYLITYKEGAVAEGLQSLKSQGLKAADARDFKDQVLALEDAGDAEAVMFPEIGVAVVGGEAFEQRGLSVQAEIAADSPIEAIEPEYFAFAAANGDYLRGFRSAVNTIAKDLKGSAAELEEEEEVDVQVLGATWGLVKCRVPPSLHSGAGIKVAVLDTGMDLGHPDFAGRAVVAQTFVGQPVQDLAGHGTHVIGTACGPKTPAGNIPRYGIGFKVPIFVGKVFSNSGTSTTAIILAGMNWAIANRCPVITLSVTSQVPPQAAYTAAGAAALARGCLMIAGAGNSASQTGAPANSPTIMAVASLDPNLSPSSFSSFGKIEIAAPGRDIFSSFSLPTKYKVMSGTSHAAPHVSGCAALWAQTSPALRAMNLWKRLQLTAKPLPFPPSRVGKGLVQAP
jgi:subtilisin